MTFTSLFAMFALLMLVVIFGITYKVKGLKAAFIATGMTFVISSFFYVAAIYAIVNAMD
jgi:hypothetical protein